MFEHSPNIELTELDQLIYTFIREQPEAVSKMRIIDLAAAVHVSNTTVMRFIKKLNFASFYEFKHYLSQEVKQNSLQDELIFQDVIADFLSEKTFQKELGKQIKEAAIAINTSQCVYCFGLGNSGIVADYFSRNLAGMGLNSYSIKESFSPYMLTSIGYTDIMMVVFSVSGETKEILKILELSIFQDKPILSITLGETSTLAKLSTMNIPYFTKRQQLYFSVDFSSQVPALLISEMIVRELFHLKNK